MPHKHVLFRTAAREKVLHGATALADAVRVTLGPKSKSVLIQKKWGHPLVCNDGVTIAKDMRHGAGTPRRRRGRAGAVAARADAIAG
ncbi:MAG TPA: chaperonin GroEL, partial [Gemmatimonadales bacterium]|nr:chaperonin GroEL [Gemmatimonadales bacterium]